MILKRFNYIDGKISRIKNNHYYTYFEKKKLCRYPDTSISSIEKIILSANKGFHINKNLSNYQRSISFKKIINYLKKNCNQIAKYECIETGKKFENAKKEINNGIKYWIAAQKLIKNKNIFQTNKNIDIITEPIGVVLLFIPWNYPFIVLCERLPFILAAGCGVIIKPSEFAATSLDFVVKAISKSMYLKKSVNIVYGSGKKIGSYLVKSKGIDMISFTGSTDTAKKIISNSHKGCIKKLSLELGGKNPIIVNDLFEIKKNIKSIVEIIMENGGQACIGGSLIYVNSKIYKTFKEYIVKELDLFKNYQYPVRKHIRNNHYNHVNLNKIFYGKKNIKSKLNKPILVENLSSQDRINTKEIFSPLISLKKFSSIKKLISNLNKSDYGLAAYLFTQEKKQIEFFKRNIRYGRVWINSSLKNWDINSPIGGFRNSGYGQETSQIGLNNYRVFKTIVN